MKWLLLTLLLAGCATKPSIDEEYKDWPLKPGRITPISGAGVIPLQIYGYRDVSVFSPIINHGVGIQL